MKNYLRLIGTILATALPVPLVRGAIIAAIAWLVTPPAYAGYVIVVALLMLWSAMCFFAGKMSSAAPGTPFTAERVFEMLTDNRRWQTEEKPEEPVDPDDIEEKARGFKV